VTTAQPLHVIIAGGGLSGLALAQGLLKDGHTCEVFERDADDSRLRPQDAAAAIAPDVTLAPVDDYVMISCSVAPGTVIPPAADWTADTPALLRDAAHLLDQLSAAARGQADLVAGIGAFEKEMREYVDPFMRMTMDHDRQFGGGALTDRASHEGAQAGSGTADA